MNYQSPIDLIISKMNMQLDGEIFKAVQNVGVNVDRDELIKALRYDRDQYEKGYADRDSEIIRCRDCKHKEKDGISEGFHYCNINGLQVTDEWFCADAERQERL